MGWRWGKSTQRKEAMKMPCKLKSLGLAVLTVLAVSAVSASAAQAGEFTAAEYPAQITGQNVNVHALTTELGVMACGLKLNGELAAASEDLTLTPTYATSCEIGGIEVHVSNNGCDYLFHAGSTLGMDEVEGSWDIKCPAGNKMDFEITSMATCHLTIPEQLGLGEVTYTTRTMAKDVDLDLSVEGLSYELSANCPVSGAFANGSYFGTTTLKADHGGAGTAFGVH